MVTLSEKLKHKIPLRIPDFERFYELGGPLILSFRDVDCREWHRDFAQRIFTAVGSGKHFPVYRLGHGEFIMAVGYQLHPGLSLRSRLIHYYILAKRKLRFMQAFDSGNETFSAREIARARAIYTEGMRSVAKEGIIAAAFNLNPGYIQYLGRYLKWLDKEGIHLHYNNYAPVYSVYALLLGPEGRHLLRGRHVLVATSLTAPKEIQIRTTLEQLGVASVQFYPISGSQAMFDKIQLDAIRRPIDIALVGAGVGAVSIIEQLRPLNALAMDVGFVLDVMADPEKRWNRPFCVADDEFEPAKVGFLGPEDIELLRGVNAEQGRHSPLLDEIETLLYRQAPRKL